MWFEELGGWSQCIVGVYRYMDLCLYFHTRIFVKVTLKCYEDEKTLSQMAQDQLFSWSTSLDGSKNVGSENILSSPNSVKTIQVFFTIEAIQTLSSSADFKPSFLKIAFMGFRNRTFSNKTWFMFFASFNSSLHSIILFLTKFYKNKKELFSSTDDGPRKILNISDSFQTLNDHGIEALSVCTAWLD